MKQLFTLFAAIIFAATIAAQKPLATVAHEGKLTFFDSFTAFDDALDNAVNGDTIFLSSGNFTSNSESVTIKKRVSIVGNGYDSFIVPDLHIDMSGNPDSYMDAPLFDGVRLKLLSFNMGFPSLSTSRDNLYKTTITNCYIKNLDCAGNAGNEVLIDRCFIEFVDCDYASDNNTLFQNCKIVELSGSDGHAIFVNNCNIGKAYYCPRSLSSSIIQAGTVYGSLSYNGNHIITNSLFPSSTIFNAYQDSIGTNFLLNDCYFDDNDGHNSFLDENLECTIDLAGKGYVGEDGTVIGVYGGYTPYTETPSVPTVDASKSSVQYDKENNKLNVTITVAPN